jgi:hypothetical protein
VVEHSPQNLERWFESREREDGRVIKKLDMAIVFNSSHGISSFYCHFLCPSGRGNIRGWIQTPELRMMR